MLEKVYESEYTTAFGNRGIANLLYNWAALQRARGSAAGLHARVLRRCQRQGSRHDGATLANGGVNPLTKKQVMPAKHVPELLAIMATAGFYDESGDWMYTAGLPAKTGVGGGSSRSCRAASRSRVLAAPERGRQQRPFAERHPRHRG